MNRLRFPHLFLLPLLCFFIPSSSKAQEQKPETIRPLLLDKAILSGVGLDTIRLPKEPERAFFQKRLFRGKDISVFIVSSESWTTPFDQFWFDEFIYIFNGSAKVSAANHPDQIFESGDFFFAPKGFEGAWGVQAGQNLHYELSVIANQRADSTQVSTLDKPYLLDKTILSGTEIDLEANGSYEQVLADGVELRIRLYAEVPQEKVLANPAQEQLIGLLSGMLEIRDAKDQVHTFYAGDFLVIPDGFTGSWRSQGHSLVKYLAVEKS